MTAMAFNVSFFQGIQTTQRSVNAPTAQVMSPVFRMTGNAVSGDRFEFSAVSEYQRGLNQHYLV